MPPLHSQIVKKRFFRKKVGVKKSQKQASNPSKPAKTVSRSHSRSKPKSTTAKKSSSHEKRKSVSPQQNQALRDLKRIQSRQTVYSSHTKISKKNRKTKEQKPTRSQINRFMLVEELKVVNLKGRTKELEKFLRPFKPVQHKELSNEEQNVKDFFQPAIEQDQDKLSQKKDGVIAVFCSIVRCWLERPFQSIKYCLKEEEEKVVDQENSQSHEGQEDSGLNCQQQPFRKRQQQSEAFTPFDLIKTLNLQGFDKRVINECEAQRKSVDQEEQTVEKLVSRVKQIKDLSLVARLVQLLSPMNSDDQRIQRLRNTLDKLHQLSQAELKKQCLEKEEYQAQLAKLIGSYMERITELKTLSTRLKRQTTKQPDLVTKDLRLGLFINSKKIQQDYQRFHQYHRKQKEASLEFQLRKSIQSGEFPGLERRQERGFHTNLMVVNGILISIGQFLELFHVPEIIMHLNTFYGTDSVTRLAQLQGRPMNKLYEEYPSFQGHSSNFNKDAIRQKLQVVIEDYLPSISTNEEVRKLELIHIRALYDAFIDELNYFRPYYELNGDTYPWFVSEKGMTYFNVCRDNLDQVFQKAKIKILKLCSQLGGLHLSSDEKIPRNETYLAGIKTEGNRHRLVIDSIQVKVSKYQEVRKKQNRVLEKMLQSDVGERQVQWTQIDQLLTKVLIQISDQVERKVIKELLLQLH